ncbi:MAG TPA: ATP-binding protein [Thermoanaerobaculia bacterium]
MVDLPEELRRRQKDTRFILGGLTALFVVCIVFYYLLQRGKDLPQSIVANRLLLFVLWYVNVILILIVLFILFRSIFHLIVDRHNRILGSKFKTKLVISAIALSLIPAIIPFPFATHFLVDSFDQWFSLPIEDVVAQARDTADALTRQIEQTNLRDARRVLDEVASYDLVDLRAVAALFERLQQLRQELQVDYLAIFDGTEAIHAIADPHKLRRDPKFRTPILREAMERGEAIQVEDSLDVEGRLILAARARRRGGEEAPSAQAPAADAPAADAPAETTAAEATSPQYTVAVIGTVLPRDVADKTDNLRRAYQHYLQVTVQKQDIRMSYLLILLMVTLVVMVAFSSIGLRLARRFTAPIQALAEGTRRISSGDLSHRVDVAVDDELGVLVNAFNSMTEELRRNKDLVDRKNRELVEANRRIRAVLQNVAAGVLVIDAEGLIRTCNGAALGILSQSDEEVIGKALAEAWSDPERGKLIELLDQPLPAGEVASHQIRLTVGGVWKTLEVKVTVLPDSAGQPGWRVVVLEDFTELIHAQKMATWNEVARRIAHEIKNPLTPIKLTAERLLRKHQQHDPELGKALEQGVEIIVREVSTLKSMVDEFSRYARMPRPQPREIDLTRFVAETVHLYRGLKPGVEVTGRVDPEAARARFDPDQLKSVLINLLDNAVESTEAPGEVTVSTARANGALLLHVADTGRGIRAEDRDKLFLPYFSTKGRGTGLGLAIVQRIVAEHDARIRVDDNRPRGTVFTLEIPLL